MSQWGDERTFREGDNKVRAIPNVVTDGFARITSESKIDRVVITHMDGDHKIVERMAKEIKERYTGALYTVWKPL